ATARAAEAGLAGRVNFVQGDAEELPLRDESVDGAICECSLCLFPDKDAAVRELARVLRPGARLALSDVTAVPESLPPELRTLSGWTACVADARPLSEIASLFERAGFVVEELEQRDELLAEVIERVDGRLHLASFLQAGIPDPLREGLRDAVELVRVARAAVEAGVVGYGILGATRP
ncbi:MAG: methyltransferase domain-containing protein, partial [Actinobacteria bacterium]|nr:methyltransferase domain-containing protein [Actinomycetota bacterium]